MKHEVNPLTRVEIIIVFYLALVVCIVAILSLLTILNKLPQPLVQSSSDIYKLSPWLILIVLCANIIPSIIENISIYRGDLDINFKTPLWYQIGRKFFFSTAMLLIIFCFSYMVCGSFSAVGIRILETFEFYYLILYGLFVWIALGVFMNIANKFSRKTVRFWETNKDEIYVFFRCRTKIERLIYSIVLPITVLSEEVIFRGYIVLMLGKIYHSFVFFGISSVFLSVLSHLYQGRKKIFQNLLFASVLVIITLVTESIILATFVHLLHNYTVVFLQWRIENKKSYQLK